MWLLMLTLSHLGTAEGQFCIEMYFSDFCMLKCILHCMLILYLNYCFSFVPHFECDCLLMLVMHYVAIIQTNLVQI